MRPLSPHTLSSAPIWRENFDESFAKAILTCASKMGSPTKATKTNHAHAKSFLFTHTDSWLLSLCSTLGFVYDTWDELIISISQVDKPLHDFEEDLSIEAP